MKKDRENLKDTPNAVEVLEFLRTARTLKRQVKLVRGIKLHEKEVEAINAVLDDLKKEFTMFKV